MNSWSSYPSIFNLGHRYVKDLLTVPVNVEEKVDGSQFSFCKTKEGELKIRSKGAEMYIAAPEKMFNKAAETVRKIADLLEPGWTYRGEYLSKRGHNALVYSRVPKDNIIIFDVSTGDQEYLDYEGKKFEAERVGLEVVPLLFSGKLETLEQFRQFLEVDSILGGQKIEGVVIKPKDYNLFGADKKVLLGKFVSEAFKEVHKKTWVENNPGNNDIITLLGQEYNTQARWQKAIIHLRERGLLEDSPKDIGLLMKEVPTDIKKECEEEIKEKLFKWAWSHIARKSAMGLPEWYKENLLKKQFENNV